MELKSSFGRATQMTLKSVSKLNAFMLAPIWCASYHCIWKIYFCGTEHLVLKKNLVSHSCAKKVGAQPSKNIFCLLGSAANTLCNSL